MSLIIGEGKKTRRKKESSKSSAFRGGRWCGGSVWTLLTENRSHKSTYLPATIWLSVFARMGEKLGPTMNGCWRSSPEGKLATKELSLNSTGTEAPTMIEVLKIGEHWVGNVATIKDGTVKLGLPWVAEGKGISCCSWKATPPPPTPPQKLRTSPFAGTNWAIKQEHPQKLMVTLRKLNYHTQLSSYCSR